jgi:AhpD family alkylhydroperoxidase
VREAFADRKLDRLTKEIPAFAASMTAKSDYGVDLHLREARRLGLPEQGLTEAVEVVQLFNTVTKIADVTSVRSFLKLATVSRVGSGHMTFVSDEGPNLSGLGSAPTPLMPFSAALAF